uniref:Uncharacterized protein n=1 Tax=Rhabditophanes sp. KR3021 TaxID=114890 RepID=A0AC35TS63_9BILA
MQNDDYGQALDQGRSRSRNTRAELSLWDYNGYTRSNNNIDQDGFKIPVIKNRITLPLRGQNGDAITLPQYLKHNEDYRGGRDANIVRSRVVTKTSRPIDERFAVDEEPVTSANVRYNKRCFLDHENELSVTGDEDCEPLNGLFAKRRKKLNQIIEESEKPKGKNQWTGSKLSKIAARLFESIPPLNLSNDSGTTFSAGLAEIGKQIFGRRNRSESDKTITFGSSEISNKVYRPSVTLHNMTTGDTKVY